MNVVIFGNDYELPAYTVDVAERMADAAKASGVKESTKARLEFLRSILGKDAAAEVCGGSALSSVDISRVGIAFMLIQRAYTKPLVEAQREEMHEQVETLREMADAMKAIADAAKAPELSRQGFSRVK